MVVLALMRKQLVESRWLLGLSAAALFGLMWLFVFATNRIENAGRNGDQLSAMRRQAMSRGIGGPSADGSSTSLEVMWWRHPLIVLILAMWPISRGSAAVAGELEKGSLDLVLSRPVSRKAYLTSQILAAAAGIALLSLVLMAGVLVGNRFNFIEAPPRLAQLVRPSLNAMAFGFAIFGLAVVLSSIDIVRWRPNLMASAIVLAMFIANVVSNIDVLPDWKWLAKVSIFTAYDPVEAAVSGAKLGFNAMLLASVGAAGCLLAYLAFGRRDLPANA